MAEGPIMIAQRSSLEAQGSQMAQGGMVPSPRFSALPFLQSPHRLDLPGAVTNQVIHIGPSLVRNLHSEGGHGITELDSETRALSFLDGRERFPTDPAGTVRERDVA